MQLELTEDERAFRDEMREFFTTKVSERPARRSPRVAS